MKTWTYEGYWNYVVGDMMSPADVVLEHGLVTKADAAEWLPSAESEAWEIGGETGDIPREWSEHFDRALEALVRGDM